MPGLVCVVGRERAGDLARTAAHPLLRRPWQTFELAASRDDVAIGFAGEHGGVVSDAATGVALALDGEIFGDRGARTGRDASEDLLRRYLAEGPTLELPQGAFAAAVWDPRDNGVVLLTDNYARRPLWIGTLGQAVLVAGELKALLAMGVQPRLDLETWAQFFAYEGSLPEQSPLEGLTLLAGGTTLRITPAGREERRRWRYRIAPDSAGDAEVWADELETLLDAAVARRLGGVGLALSGGYDSRCVASLARVRGLNITALTYGARSSRDLQLGAETAAALGIAHRTVPLEPGYIARGAAETVWLSEGAVRAFHCHHLALRGLRADGADAVFICYGGDHVLRTIGGALRTGGEAVVGDNLHTWRAQVISDELLEDVFTPDFAAQIRGLARTSMRRGLDKEEGDPLAQARQLIFTAQSRKIWPGAELFRDDLAPRDPYDDYELVDRFRHLPEHLRVDGAVQKTYLRRYAELAAVRDTADELPPGLSGRRRRIAELTIRARRGLRRRIDDRVGPRWWPLRSGLGDYASDLRSVGGAELLGMLLEPRTLGRGQLQEAPVRRLIDETLTGRARHTKALGALLTFELFQRQFVDGEGFALAARDPREVAGAEAKEE